MFEQEIAKVQELINAIMELSPIMAESCACMLCDEIAKKYGRKAEDVADEVRNMVYQINAELGAY